jgi:ketosteroid isomerase-like protein
VGAEEPGQASKLFETWFGDGDLEKLMSLYEDGAVLPTSRGVGTGLGEIREILKGYLDSKATLTMNDSVVFEAGDLALVHWSWTMRLPDGSTADGATAEVLRRQADGTWRFVIDSPDGAALIGHD